MATVVLRLIGTTDVHAHIHPYDYYRDAPDENDRPRQGRDADRAARAEARNALLLDNGDLIQGSPLGDWAAEALGAGADQDASDDRGDERARLRRRRRRQPRVQLRPRSARRRARRRDFPFVCCNVLKPDGAPYFTPWTILRGSASTATAASAS